MNTELCIKVGKWKKSINFNIYNQFALEVISVLEEHNGDTVKWHQLS